MDITFDRNKVVIADKSHYSVVSQLRYLAYSKSKSFEVVDQDALKDYCDWSDTDECGLVLLALDKSNEAICTLRGNVYFSQKDL